MIKIATNANKKLSVIENINLTKCQNWFLWFAKINMLRTTIKTVTCLVLVVSVSYMIGPLDVKSDIFKSYFLIMTNIPFYQI